jgi:hypothetical protein
MKNSTQIANITIKPTLIARKLGYKGRLNPEGPEWQHLKSLQHVEFGYDPEEGSIRAKLDSINLRESIQELRDWFTESSIPLSGPQGSHIILPKPAFATREENLLMESLGFITKEYQWHIQEEVS